MTLRRTCPRPPSDGRLPPEPPRWTRSYRQNFLGISPGQRHDQRSFRIKDEDHLECVDQPGRDRLRGAMAGIGLGDPYREEMDLPEVRDPLERSLVLPADPELREDP